MCDLKCLDFTRSSFSAPEVAGKAVLEVGALDVNGSPRSILEPLGPAKYVGADIALGKGVDVVCKVDLISQFGRDSFDIVLSTEMLEHVLDWRAAVSNLKGVLKPGGTLLVTTRRVGMPYHGYPYDFWRYEQDDFRTIFSDMTIERLELDDRSHGIFLKATKPEGFVEARLDSHRLFSILSGRRAVTLHPWEIRVLSTGRLIGDRIYPVLGPYRNLLPTRLKSLAKNLFGRHYTE